jgi:hypothetical protein
MHRTRFVIVVAAAAAAITATAGSAAAAANGWLDGVYCGRTSQPIPPVQVFCVNSSQTSNVNVWMNIEGGKLLSMSGNVKVTCTGSAPGPPPPSVPIHFVNLAISSAGHFSGLGRGLPPTLLPRVNATAKGSTVRGTVLVTGSVGPLKCSSGPVTFTATWRAKLPKGGG